jgi:hypothetical protein
MNKVTYHVWTVAEGDSIKFYVVNLRFGRIHSSWDDLMKARNTAKDLNFVTEAQQDVIDKASR